MGESSEHALDTLHLDMDCFFVAVEVLDDPTLARRPVVVGGTEGRGVVCSASYEARAFGVHAAMPTSQAMRSCPDAVFISPHFDRYSEMNRRLLEVIEAVTPEYEPIAFDEAFINVEGAHRLFGDSQQIARSLRATVLAELGLACSVGVGRSKLIAKLASKAAKPRVRLSDDRPPRPIVTDGVGVQVVGQLEELDFLYTHPIRALPGIGPKTAERLRSLGMITVADIAAVGRDRLVSLFGDHQGNHVFDMVTGVDRRTVERDREVRSVGSEVTFPRDLYDPDELASRAREFSTKVASRARSRGLLGRTVTLKVRFADLTGISRSRTQTRPPQSAEEISTIAEALLGEVACERGIRLLGVHLSNFVGEERVSGEQLSLFSSDSEVAEEESIRNGVGLDETRDEILRRFGPGAVDPLALLNRHTRNDHSATNPRPVR